MALTISPCCTSSYLQSKTRDMFPELRKPLSLGKSIAELYINDYYTRLNDASVQDIAKFTTEIIYALNQMHWYEHKLSDKEHKALYKVVVDNLARSRATARDLELHHDYLLDLAADVRRSEPHRQLLGWLKGDQPRYSRMHRVINNKARLLLDFWRFYLDIEERINTSEQENRSVYDLGWLLDRVRV